MKEITKEVYLKWYEDMQFWRKFEDKLAALYIQQKVRGFLHLYNGQEAVLAGALHAMDLSKDKMITAYRNHVQPIGMGVDPRRIMAELLGKATGTSKGLGGSMHIFSKEHGFYGGHGIVGAQIPVGAGMAFADKYFNTGGVTLTYFGDGAARQGSLHEAFNMAMLWKLPVVFIVENNGYAMGTSVERTANHTDIWKLGLGYEMPCGPSGSPAAPRAAAATWPTPRSGCPPGGSRAGARGRPHTPADASRPAGAHHYGAARIPRRGAARPSPSAARSAGPAPTGTT